MFALTRDEINRWYARYGLRSPVVLIHQSPLQWLRRIGVLMDRGGCLSGSAVGVDGPFDVAWDQVWFGWGEESVDDAWSRGLDVAMHLDLRARMTRVAWFGVGWVIPLADVCHVVLGPVECLYEDGLLHSENAPAMRFQDGFVVYAWHGVRIPASWVLQGVPDLADWQHLRQKNVGMRMGELVNPRVSGGVRCGGDSIPQHLI